MGADHPVLEIIEFADYQCFQCRKMHYYLRQLVARYPNKIRLIHRHYPMDDKVNPVVQEPFHVGSGAMAMLAIQAGLKGKFWEMNDVLYELGGKGESIDVAAAASRVGLNASEIGAGIRNTTVLAKLRKDIQAGLQLGIAGTPAYLVNGTLSLGTIPPESLKVVFE
jgi:protein-disulfide isomerase